MLKSIVEQDDISILGTLVARQLFDTVAAFLVNGNIDTRKLFLHLVGFVANFLNRCIGNSQYIAVALPLIASTEDSHLRLVLQQAYEIFHMRRLPRNRPQ